MKASLQVDIDFNQLLALVKQLPNKEKIMLTRELEKDIVDTKLSALLVNFKTDELNEETIDEEVEIVRQQIYDQQKH